MIYDADCNVSPSKMDFTRLEDSYPDYLKSLKDENHPILQEVSHTISNFNPDIVGITVCGLPLPLLPLRLPHCARNMIGVCQ